MWRFYLGLFVVCALVLGLLVFVQMKEEGSVPNPPSPTLADKPIEIPGIQQPTDDSWIKQAHQVEVMTPVGNAPATKAGLAVAWTPTSLLLRIRSDDVTPYESSKNAWENDSVEIFLASSPGSDDRLQYVVVPGRTPDHPDPVSSVNDKRQDPPLLQDLQISRDKDDKGYAMTIAVPWANLKHIPHPGDVIGLQVYVNDAQGDGQISHRVWYPQHGASENPELVQHVQLGGEASETERAAVWIHASGLNSSVNVSALPEDEGKKIVVWSGNKQVGSTELKDGGADGSKAEIPLSTEWTEQKGATLVVTLDGRPVSAGLKIPDLAKQRLELIKKLPMAASPAIFSGEDFPKIDFLNKEIVEAAIGTYTLHMRYFDSGWNEVGQPTAPGRYGAMVEFKAEDGLTFLKYLTLFKTPKPYAPMKDPYEVTVKFPATFGLPANELAKEQWNINDWEWRTIRDGEKKDSNAAVLVAGLQDMVANPERWHGFTPWSVDDEWWTELRKRIGVSEEGYPHLTYLPDDYNKDPKKTWPLILFLHGAGERGDDLSKVKNQGPQGYINSGHPLPFIVVTPQCPADDWWSPERLMKVIDQVAVENRVDVKHVYVTGLSMGGYGTFELAARYPDTFAAIAPLSGGANPEIAPRLKKMPAWIFHGAEDDVVPTLYSTNVAAAMQKAGAPVKLTIYPGVGHGNWDKTYADPALYAWFLEHSK